MQHEPTTSCAAAPKAVMGRLLPAGPRSRQKKTWMHICPHPDCGKPCRHPSDLRQHLRIHSGEKPFVCSREGCRRAFAHPGSRNNHVRIHSREKPFVCSYEDCGRSFTESGARTRHLRTHTGEKPFACPYEGCRRAFAQSNNLKRHLLVHTGEKPDVCLSSSRLRQPVQQPQRSETAPENPLERKTRCLSALIPTAASRSTEPPT